MKRIIAGPNQVEEAIKARVSVQILYVQSGLSQKTAARLYSLANTHNVKTQAVDKTKLDELAGQLNHQGVIAVTGEFQYTDLEHFLKKFATTERNVVLILDQIQDPGNLGAILRSAYSLGAGGVIITKNRSAQVTAATVRASVGACELLPVVRVVNLVSTINALKDEGYQVFGASLEGSDDVDRIDWPAKTAVVLGNEGKGIRKLTGENCDVLFKIPMATSFESLNVSAAAAIVLYELLRTVRLTDE